MMRFVLAVAVGWLGVNTTTRASSVLPLSTDEHLRLAEAVCRGTVLKVVSFKDAVTGVLQTRTSVRVEETFKGRFPPVVSLVHAGGEVGNEGHQDGFAPRFRIGEERLLFLARRKDGTLFALQGGPSAVRLEKARPSQSGAGQSTRSDYHPQHRALLEEVRARSGRGGLSGSDVSDEAGSAGGPVAGEQGAEGGIQPASFSGLLVDSYGVPARYTATDRGEPIPYLVDADVLPMGVSLSQALIAVSNALAAWSAVSSARFRFEGVQSFGTASANVSTSDGKLRIQLHDLYGYISGPTTLGLGGRGYLGPLLSGWGWGLGGNVAGNEFHLTTRAFIVLKHTSAAMQNLTTFTEVLCHEAGHALGLAHSSENPSETNPTLKQAMMYFQAHQDGRGATLGSYDPPMVRQVHPQANTPPYCYPRVMDVTTAATPPNVSNINEVEMRGYDLQSTNLTLATANGSQSYGSFAQVGNKIRYTPDAFYSDSARVDPATSGYYDVIYARFSDGTNASPYVSVRVISYNEDDYPMPSDGIPNNWMITYFGNANPAAGPKRNASSDYDGDGLSNLQEYLAGSNPTATNSAQRITAFNLNGLQWQAKAYELYELHGTTNFSTWTRVGNPILPTSSTGTASGYTNSVVPQQFFRVFKVP